MNALAVLAFFAFIQNIDNMLTAGAYRLKNVVIPIGPNMVMAALSGAATAIGVVIAGLGESTAFHLRYEWVSEAVGRGLLVMIGVWTLAGYFRARLFPQIGDAEEREELELPAGSVRDGSVRMTASAALVPGFALAVDNIAPSFALGLVNLRHGRFIATGVTFTALIMGFSLLSVWIGQAMGRGGKNHLRWVSPEIASGLLMITIAVLGPGDLAEGWFRR